VSPGGVYDVSVDRTTTAGPDPTAALDDAPVPSPAPSGAGDGTTDAGPGPDAIAPPVGRPAPTTTAAPPASVRSGADLFMRRLLRIPDQRKPVPESETHRIFGVSIFLSATRCLLSYIVLPIVLPFLGLARGVGPWLGIPIGVLALYFDVLGIRRFWLADHHQRWLFSAIYAVVGAMVLTLLIVDIVDLVG
jgi:hypothetical protein